MSRHWLSSTQQEDDDDEDDSNMEGTRSRGVLGGLSKETTRRNERSTQARARPTVRQTTTMRTLRRALPSLRMTRKQRADTHSTAPS